MFIEFDPSAEDNSLGKYLKSIREEKEVTIEELAEVTRIKQHYLEAIEDDRLDDLPTGPYLTLFLKSYCETLEIDYDELMQTFQVEGKKPAKQQARPPKQKKQQPAPLKPVVDAKKQGANHKHEKKQPHQKKETEKAPAGQKPEIVNYLILTGVIVFVAFIALIILITFRGGEEGEGSHAQTAHQTEQHEADTHGDSEAETEPAITAPPIVDSTEILRERFLASYDKLELIINPEQQQQVTLVADGDSTQKLVNPSRTWTFVADEELVISCERMDKTKYYVNGFRLKTDSLDFAGEHSLLLNRSNWIEFVDTTDVR